MTVASCFGEVRIKVEEHPFAKLLLPIHAGRYSYLLPSVPQVFVVAPLSFSELFPCDYN